MSNKITITIDDLTAAFQLWSEEYLNDVEEFDDIDYCDKDYPDKMADTMLEYLKEVTDPEV